MEFGNRLNAARSYRDGLRDNNYIEKGWRPKLDGTIQYWENGAGDRVYIVDTTSGAVTVTFPSASRATGTKYTVKRTDGSANALNITAVAGNIDGTPTYSIITQYSSLTMFSDGSSYWIV